MKREYVVAIMAAILRAAPTEGGDWSCTPERGVEEAEEILNLAEKRTEERLEMSLRRKYDRPPSRS